MKYIKAMRTYEVDGEERVKWYIVGEIFEGKDNKEYCRLNQNPQQIYYVFEADKDLDKRS